MRYSVGQIWLHWISAVVILWTLFSGFYVAFIDVAMETKNWVGFINVSLSALYIPIFILRVYFSFFHGFLAYGRKRCAAEYVALVVHKAIYLVLGIVLVTGVLMMDRPINIFNVLLIAQLLTDPTAIEWFTQIHIQACVVLAVLVALHVGAVFKHAMSGRPVLKNMSFSQETIRQ